IMNETAVIFVNHNMATLSRVCNKILYLKDGQPQFFGDNVLKGIEMYLSQFDDEQGFIDYNGKGQFNELVISSNIDRGFDVKGRPILNHGDDLIIDFDYNLEPSCGLHELSIVISNKDFLTLAFHKTGPI